MRAPACCAQSRIAIDAALAQLTSPPAAASSPAVPMAATPPAAPPAAPPAEDAMEVDAVGQPARPEDAMVDEDEDLAAAIALSQQAGPSAAAGDDPELAAALALSSTNTGLRSPPPAPAPAPAAAQSGAQSGAQEALAQRVREIFQELSASGLEPNAAAAQAFEQAKRELGGAPPAVVAPPPELLSREGLEAPYSVVGCT
jgi:hypothetical protein